MSESQGPSGSQWLRDLGADSDVNEVNSQSTIGGDSYFDGSPTRPKVWVTTGNMRAVLRERARALGMIGREAKRRRAEKENEESERERATDDEAGDGEGEQDGEEKEVEEEDDEVVAETRPTSQEAPGDEVATVGAAAGEGDHPETAAVPAAPADEQWLRELGEDSTLGTPDATPKQVAKAPAAAATPKDDAAQWLREMADATVTTPAATPVPAATTTAAAPAAATKTTIPATAAATPNLREDSTVGSPVTTPKQRGATKTAAAAAAAATPNLVKDSTVGSPVTTPKRGAKNVTPAAAATPPSAKATTPAATTPAVSPRAAKTAAAAAAAEATPQHRPAVEEMEVDEDEEEEEQEEEESNVTAIEQQQQQQQQEDEEMNAPVEEREEPYSRMERADYQVAQNLSEAFDMGADAQSIVREQFQLLLRITTPETPKEEWALMLAAFAANDEERRLDAAFLEREYPEPRASDEERKKAHREITRQVVTRNLQSELRKMKEEYGPPTQAD